LNLDGTRKLLDQKGLYYAMWRQQVGEREADRAGEVSEVRLYLAA